MSEPTQPGPPPLIGAGGSDQSDQEKNVTDKEQAGPDEQQAEAAKVVDAQPDRSTDPYGESSLGFSVTNVDDEDKPESEEAKTAFNSPKEQVPVPSDEGQMRTWGNELHAVVDPFEEGPGSPFDKGGFVGVDPYRAVVSEVRDPDPSGQVEDDSSDEN